MSPPPLRIIIIIIIIIIIRSSCSPPGSRLFQWHLWQSLARILPNSKGLVFRLCQQSPLCSLLIMGKKKAWNYNLSKDKCPRIRLIKKRHQKNLSTVKNSYFTHLPTTTCRFCKKLMTKLDFNPVWRSGPHGYGKLQEEDQRATAGGSLLKKDRFAAHWHLKKKQQQKKETSPIKKVFAVIPEANHIHCNPILFGDVFFLIKPPWKWCMPYEHMFDVITTNNVQYVVCIM